MEHKMCVFFYFPYNSLSEIFLILRRIERDMIKKCILVFKQSTRKSCQILKKI